MRACLSHQRAPLRGHPRSGIRGIGGHPRKRRLCDDAGMGHPSGKSLPATAHDAPACARRRIGTRRQPAQDRRAAAQAVQVGALPRRRHLLVNTTMHPAFSVIFLTTLIGVGQGLFLALFTAQSYALFDLLPTQSGRTFYALGSLMALVFLVAGLAGSFFHLGRPERAWRAMAQWRTSWLSRETLVLPAFMGMVFLYGITHWVDWKPVVATLPSGIRIDATVSLGVVGTILAFGLFLC